MDEEDMYETLGEGVSVGVSLTAGAMAGIAEHCVMYPVDSVKTRMQALACENQIRGKGIITNILKIMKEEGITRPVKGVQVMAMGAGPAHALYFSCYEQLKVRLSRLQMMPDSVAYGLAGGAATLFHDAIMTPAEAVKQRVQMCCSPYKNCRSCVRIVLRDEGFSAFYRSYTTQLAMNIPFQATHFIAYEAVQNFTNPTHEYNPMSHIISGALAGAVAATVTMPLDVCKTLLNTQEPSLVAKLPQDKIVGIFGAVRTVYTVAGLPGFFYGLKARVLYQMPATAIAWSVYEGFKHGLNKYSQHENDNHPYDTLSQVRKEKLDEEKGRERDYHTTGVSSAATSNITAQGGHSKHNHPPTGGSTGNDSNRGGGSKLWETITDISTPRAPPTRLHAASEAWSSDKLAPSGGPSGSGGLSYVEPPRYRFAPQQTTSTTTNNTSTTSLQQQSHSTTTSSSD